MIENWTGLLGALAGTCTTLAFVPQVWRVWKTRSVADISLGMYVVFVSGVGLWLAYGVLIHSWPIVVTNLVTFVLAGLVLVMKIVFDRQAQQRHKDDAVS